MVKRKSFHVLILGVLCLFCGCTPNDDVEKKEKKIEVVVTTIPLFDWTRSIVGSASNIVNITILQDSGIDLHDYQPTARDIINISKADIFIHIGGISDAWVPNVLSQTSNAKIRTINAYSLVKNDIKKECHGKCNHHDHHHDHHHHDHTDDHNASPDEHIWLSLRLAKKICPQIAATLSEAYPEDKEAFLKNAENYCAKLSELDKDFASYVSSAKYKDVIIADRFPFSHFFKDYGLTHFAAFEGCSAETDASFQTIMNLSKKLHEIHIPAVYTIDGGNEKFAKKIIEMSKRKNVSMRTLNSMQNTSLDKFNELGGYIGIMKSNIESLKETVK
jgi:zinc transport system substrate-binding protein